MTVLTAIALVVGGAVLGAMIMAIINMGKGNRADEILDDRAQAEALRRGSSCDQENLLRAP